MSCFTRTGHSCAGTGCFRHQHLISGLLWRGKPFQCLLLARGMAVQHVHCTEMVAELSEKLRETFGFSENRIRAVLYDFRRISEQVDITGDLHVVTNDPHDDKFVECALAAGATAIVSGDHHLLELDSYEEIPVLSATEFLANFT